MATLLPLGPQLFDDLGLPLAGGFIKFYAAGTLTLKTIYATENSAGATLTNPLQLDSEGRIPSAGCWLLGSYRIIVTDSDSVPIYDMDYVKAQDLVDWSTLTATISEINAVAGSLGTAGVVQASKAVVVDTSKDIGTFGILTGATLRATSAVRTPQINDANNVAAVTVQGVASQVNAVKVTPAIAAGSPSISAFGADTNIDLALAGQGTGKVKLSGLKYPSADGTTGQFISTNGSGVLTFSSVPTNTQIVKQIVTATTTANTSNSTVMAGDDSIPQNTEGAEVLTATISPTSASSTLVISGVINVGSGSAIGTTVALFKDSTADALIAAGTYISNTTEMVAVCFTCVVSAASTASADFKVRIGPKVAGTAYCNGSATGRKYGGVAASTLTITEY